METKKDPTPRELEVLRAIWEGKRTVDIADALHVSVKTIEAHRAKLYRKFGADSVVGAVRFALEHGYLQVNPQ